ncbi:EamA family transporter [Streptomyces sp. NPDC013157]|uniref:EamA family transporter n=1 Tax=Streptomyces sp. NPDC013157 TaxID=3364861 RepID=UPI0036AE12A6
MLWGTTGTASSLAPSGVPAAAIGAAGLALGGLLLFLTAPGSRSLAGVCNGGERRLLAVGSLAVAGYPLTFYPAVARTGVAVATVIALGGAPVLAGLLAWFTRRSRPSARWAAATAAAVLGCTVLVLGPGLAGDGAPWTPSVCCWRGSRACRTRCTPWSAGSSSPAGTPPAPYWA